MFHSFEKTYAPVLNSAIRGILPLAGCSFSLMTDRTFVAYHSDELGEFMSNMLGSGSTASVSVTYYKERKLNVEFYFARELGREVSSLLRQALDRFDDHKIDRVDYAPYRAGSTDTMFGLWLEGVDERNFANSLNLLFASATFILTTTRNLLSARILDEEE